ncbi:hypothetical protein LIER_31355 [Lithospermum erythrorhizon]|uniref:KIB1-4 beta-propeller domain-containing protein n=1 Tax=Lithospermum erythrorhizon TaxID=34254 RepID=A0AAV3RSJ9_LITER
MGIKEQKIEVAKDKRSYQTTICVWIWVVLELILNKVIPLPDFLCFVAVCKTWRNAATSDPKHMQRRLGSCTKQVPLLLVPVPAEEKVKKWWNDKKSQRRLCTLSGRKLPKFKISLPFNVRSCGSSHGWLAFSTGSGKEIHITLYNPFSRIEITNLPIIKLELHFSDLPQFVIRKVILSANPSVSPDDFYVVAICGLRVYPIWWSRLAESFWQSEDLGASGIISV